MSVVALMNSLFPDDLLNKLHATGVAAVLVMDDVSAAVPVAEALLRGGVSFIEFTLRTPVALDCVQAIRSAVPDMIVGAGTVLTPLQAEQARDAGAAFAVSPGVNPAVINHAINIGLPFAPGVMTPTDIELAVQCGCRELKFFPAVPSGGLPYLRSAAAPFRHLGLSYLPLGGISADNLSEWIREPDVIAVGGSWLVPADAVKAKDWDQLTELATAATRLVQQHRAEA
jgi:2-dehydro-3-deoxyphosphogluconate aldolase/(4S)-4-hydroxy-2-oxoglutarate aldolase